MGGRLIAENRELLTGHIERLRITRITERAMRLTDTSQTTRCVTRLTRTHVSSALQSRFCREVSSLGLNRIQLADIGGGKGNLRHRVQLVGAVQQVRVDAVLSEGERSALGLAGFLTEVESDVTNSAVVFDDPVSSLDHVRQERVARRLVELAASRQVIIFTHDLAFVIDVKRAAALTPVEVFEQWVSRRRDYIGTVVDGNPWEAQLVRRRIDEMRRRLAAIRKTYEGPDPAELQRVVRSWYHDLRARVGARVGGSCYWACASARPT